MLGAPLGHGFHGARLCSQLGESRRFKSYYPGPLSSPRGRAPRLVPVRPSAPSRLHGRGQRVIPERLSQDSAAPSRAHGTVARLLLQLPPSSCSSSSSPSPPGARAQLQLLGEQLRGRGTVTPGPLASARHGTLWAQLLPASRLRGWSGPLPPARRPRAPLPLQLLPFAACSPGVSAPRAPASPSLPGRRSHLQRLPSGLDSGWEERGRARSDYKVSALGAALRIKEGRGRGPGETRRRGWFRPKRPTRVTFSKPCAHTV